MARARNTKTVWATSTEITSHEPQKRRCTLYDECEIRPGTTADYKRLSVYHYRATGIPPAIHQVYVALHKPSGRVIGATVYAAPALNLGARNAIFGDRFKIGGGSTLLNTIRSGRLNKELELAIRIVVHPTFRGIGLSVRLHRETLPLRPYRYIEASATMGAMNPFLEQAGMIPVRVAQSPITARVLGALRSVGMTDDEIANWKEIVRKLESLNEETRRWLWRELEEYATRWIKSRTNRVVVITPEIAARRVASNAMLQPCYYFWENRDRSTEGVVVAGGQDAQGDPEQPTGPAVADGVQGDGVPEQPADRSPAPRAVGSVVFADHPAKGREADDAPEREVGGALRPQGADRAHDGVDLKAGG